MAKAETCRRGRACFRESGAAVATILCAVAVGVAAPAHAVTLRWQPTPGAAAAYALRVSSETRSVGPGNRLSVTGAEGRLGGALTVAPPEKPDQVTLLCRIVGGTRLLSVQDKVRRSRAPASRERVTMTARGETVDWEVTGGHLTGLEPPLEVMLEPADLCAFEGYGAFPEHDLQPGDSWSGEYQEPGEEPQLVRYRSTLLGVGRFRGRPYARIATTYELAPPEEGPEAGGDESFAVAMQGEVLWGFDLERGLMLYYVETMKTTAALTLTEGGGTFGASIRSRLKLIGQMTAYDGSPLGAFAPQP